MMSRSDLNLYRMDNPAVPGWFIIGAALARPLSIPNYAGNIIANLAGLPDFLRKPMLRMRVAEFPGLSGEEKAEVINNALEASPSIPFPVFAKLLKTWLEVVAELPPDQRRMLLGTYAGELAVAPEKSVALHVDGILGVFRELGEAERGAIGESIRQIVGGMEAEHRRRILLLMPTSAKEMLGI